MVKTLGLLAARLAFAMALYAVMSVTLAVAIGEPMAMPWSWGAACLGMLAGLVAIVVIRPRLKQA